MKPCQIEIPAVCADVPSLATINTGNLDSPNVSITHNGFELSGRTNMGRDGENQVDHSGFAFQLPMSAARSDAACGQTET